MSRDFTFKENMSLSKICEMPPFGKFVALYDKNELFAFEGTVPVTKKDEKIVLFKKLLEDYINDYNMDYKDSTCVDVAEFLLDYLDEMQLLNEPEFEELNDTLNELKNSNGTLAARDSFKFVLNYSTQIKLFDKDNLER